MQSKTDRPASRLILATTALTALVTLGLLAPAASAQCAAASECDALKAQLMDFKEDFRGLKQEAKAARGDLRNTDPGSPERKALRQQIRALRKAARELRHEARPVRRAYRDGCKNC